MTLRIGDLAFEYDSESVLDGVDLDVGRGELLGLVGPNGSGKSTLLRCVDRILEPQAGHVYVDGEDLEAASREAVARTVGYVPQQETSTFPATVFDTVMMGRKPYISWRPTDEDRGRVATVIDALGLSELALRDVTELGGGQRQKVLVGRALAQETEVLLLDEPTASLDVRHQLEVLDLVREQADGGITVIMAMHDLNLAARYSDALAMLYDERIYAVGPPEEVLTPANIRTAYGIDATVTDHNGRLLVVPEEPADAGDSTPLEATTD